jgi:hypothetical protein
MARGGKKPALGTACRHLPGMAFRIDPVQIALRGGSQDMEPMHRPRGQR